MSRLRWPDSTNSVSEKPGTIQHDGDRIVAPDAETVQSCDGILHMMSQLGIRQGPATRRTHRHGSILSQFQERMDSRGHLSIHSLSPWVIYPFSHLFICKSLALSTASHDYGDVHWCALKTPLVASLPTTNAPFSIRHRHDELGYCPVRECQQPL